MREKYLFLAIKTLMVLVVVSHVLIYAELLSDILPKVYVEHVYMLALFSLFVCFWISIISRFFLHGFKGLPLETMETMYGMYYLILTKEAREEWRACIEELRKKSGEPGSPEK